MSRPSDESVACAFVLKALCYQEMARLGASVPSALEFIDEVTHEAEQFDAEADGTDRQPVEICDCGFARGSFGCDDSHRILAELTTSPERVQIPAESEHVAPYTPPDGKIACPIPTCRAELIPGQTCGGANCGLKTKEMPDV